MHRGRTLSGEFVDLEFEFFSDSHFPVDVSVDVWKTADACQSTPLADGEDAKNVTSRFPCIGTSFQSETRLHERQPQDSVCDRPGPIMLVWRAGGCKERKTMMPA